MSDRDHDQRSPDASSVEDRLGSWKEIASYLQRDVRTVQRWETNEGLPVHRHAHDKLASVYAFPSEIDAWLQARTETERPEAVPERKERGPPGLLPWLVAGSVAAVVVFAAGWVAQRGESSVSGSTESRLGTRRAANGPVGAISPDGRHLAHTGSEAGGALAVVDRDSGESRLLTDRGRALAWADRPVFSPDGQKVAYTWAALTGGSLGISYSVRVVDVDGGEPRVVLADPSWYWTQPLHWSPDGDALLCSVVTPGGDELRLVSMRDGSSRLLTRGFEGSEGRARFAPDGRSLAFERSDPGSGDTRDIYLLATDGSRERPLVRHPADDALLDWTPDGRWLLFASDRTGSLATWALRVIDGRPEGAPRFLMPGPERIDPLGFTDDGTFWYVSSIPGQAVHLATIDLRDGTVLESPRPIDQRWEGFTRWPEWSPDGTRLVSVFSGPDGSEGLSILSLESGDSRLLRPALGTPRRLRWHPHEDRLLFHGRDAEGRGGMFVVDVGTGAVTTILRHDERSFPRQAYWGQDGRSILYFWAGGPLLRRSLADGSEAAIQPLPDGFPDFAPSPDRTRLLFFGPGLRLVEMGGGEERDLLEVGDGQWIYTATWSGAGTQILFARSHIFRTDLPDGLWLMPASGGTPVRVGVTMPRLRDLRLHPDGRRLAFSADSSDTELWSLENLLEELSTPR